MSARSRSHAVRAAVVVALWCSSQAIRAQDASALQIHGASRCVNTTTLHARIANYLGKAPIPSDLAIEVELTGAAPQFRVLRADTTLAERRFAPLPAGCAERRDAIAIAIAVALEHAIAGEPETPDASPSPDTRTTLASAPRAAAAASSAQPPSAASEPAADDVKAEARPARPAQPVAAEPAHAHQRPRRPRQRFMLHAGAMYFIAAVPSPVAALAIGAEYALVPELRIGVTGLLSESGELALEGGRVEHQLFGGQATACWNTPLSLAILHACTGASAAYVHAQGFDYDPGRTTGMLWLAALVRGAFELPITDAFAVRVAADGRINLSRPSLRLERPGAEARTHAASPIGVSIGADVLVRLE